MSCIGVIGEVSESKQFQWSIADFFSLSTKARSFYSSPSFMFENTSLHLNIYPGDNLHTETEFLSVFLANESDRPFHAEIWTHIKKADGSLTRVKYSNFSIPSHQSRGYPKFYSRIHLAQNKSELAPSDVLTIVCVLKPIQDGKQATAKADNAERMHSEQTDETAEYRRLIELDILSENLKDLSANKDSCDVVLEVEDKEFEAHKVILMARSPVFAAMFQHDTLEKQTGVVKVPDCDSESFQEFLDYLYRGKLEDVSFRSAFHLYSTSNKYDVQKLKEFCIEFLIHSLSPDNVCDIATLADQYDEIKLMTETQFFFNENLTKIFPTTEWANFMTKNSRLANKFLVQYSKAKDSQ